jgi:lipopolysaccharide export system permease protein
VTLLDRYIARTLLAAVGTVMLALLLLGMLFVFIGEQGNVGIGHYGMLDALQYAVLTLPQFALESFPAGALIGALLGIGLLARSQELTVMRAAGVSKLRLSVGVLLSAALLVAAALLIGEFLAQPLGQLADEQKALAKYSNMSFAGAGAWIRDGNVILNVQDRSSAAEFGGMLIFDLTDDNRLTAVARADRARAAGKQLWELHDYVESRFVDDTVTSDRIAQRPLRTAAGADFLRLVNSDSSELSLRTLHAAIRYLRANNLGTDTYEIAFWSRTARTVGIMVAMLFALPFGLGSLRRVSVSARTTFGVALGIVYVFLQRLVESGTQVFSLNPVLLAWVPTGLLALVTAMMLWRVR